MGKAILCQYPKSDNFHFYTNASISWVLGKGMCQYPKSDNFHFYAPTQSGSFELLDVSIS